MITKERAMQYCRSSVYIETDTQKLWRANGACKTWKTRPNEFKLPIKHGLYSYGYITHENAHLFVIV